MEKRGHEAAAGRTVATGNPGPCARNAAGAVSSTFAVFPRSRLASGHLSGDGIKLDWLRKQIEAVAAKPVIIDHPISEQVHYDVRWDPSKPDSFEIALRDQLRVEVKHDLRDIEFLVLEDRENRKP